MQTSTVQITIKVNIDSDDNTEYNEYILYLEEALDKLLTEKPFSYPKIHIEDC